MKKLYEMSFEEFLNAPRTDEQGRLLPELVGINIEDTEEEKRLYASREAAREKAEREGKFLIDWCKQYAYRAGLNKKQTKLYEAYLAADEAYWQNFRKEQIQIQQQIYNKMIEQAGFQGFIG